MTRTVYNERCRSTGRDMSVREPSGFGVGHRDHGRRSDDKANRSVP